MDAKNKTRKNPFVNFYLVSYNLLSALGWLYILYLTIKTSLTWKSQQDFVISKNLYPAIRSLLKILLATAGLEVFHAALKLVPSNPIVVFPQVFIRILVIWGVADTFSTSTDTIGLFILSLAWSLSETIRYFYYLFNLLNSEPFILKLLRYNLFIILYPTGAFAEIILIVKAAFYIQPFSKRKEYSFLLPNKFNISFDLYYFFWIWIMLYFPVFPLMYKHMLIQRKKYLYGKEASKKSN